MEKALSIVTPLLLAGLLYFIRRLILAHDENTKAISQFTTKLEVFNSEFAHMKRDVERLNDEVFG